MLCKTYLYGYKKPTLIVGRRQDTNHIHSTQLQEGTCQKNVNTLYVNNQCYFPLVFTWLQVLKAHCAESTYNIVHKYTPIMFQINFQCTYKTQVTDSQSSVIVKVNKFL